MRRRQSLLPTIWLMTDERMGERLWEALERLPRGSGVILRHYSLPIGERRALFAKVARVARRRRLILLRAGEGPLGPEEHGVHGRTARRTRPELRTMPVHSRTEAITAVRRGADALFVSPVFATRSHPGARALGPVRLGLMIAGLDVPVIALGGMDARRARALRVPGLYGWAAIDAWSAADQKRKAVPT